MDIHRGVAETFIDISKRMLARALLASNKDRAFPPVTQSTVTQLKQWISRVTVDPQGCLRGLLEAVRSEQHNILSTITPENFVFPWKLPPLAPIERTSVYWEVTASSMKWDGGTIKSFVQYVLDRAIPVPGLYACSRENNFGWATCSSRKPNMIDVLVNKEIQDMTRLSTDILFVGHDYIDGHEAASKFHAIVPYGSLTFIARKNNTPLDLLHPRSIHPRRKTRFCLFMYKHMTTDFKVSKKKKEPLSGWGNLDTFFDGVEARNDFYDLLNAAKHVESTAHEKSRRESDVRIPDKRFERNPDGSAKMYDAAVAIQRDFKFVIAFENKDSPGWITEKIVNPLLAGSIPIYWGTDDVFKYFNKKAFIAVRRFPSMDACVKHILQVDSNPDLYDQYVSEPAMTEAQFKMFFKWHDSVNDPDWYTQLRRGILSVLPSTEVQRIKNVLLHRHEKPNQVVGTLGGTHNNPQFPEQFLELLELEEALYMRNYGVLND